jgi:mannosyl-oligosaccharide alpha-1,2-mannosidase
MQRRIDTSRAAKDDSSNDPNTKLEKVQDCRIFLHSFFSCFSGFCFSHSDSCIILIKPDIMPTITRVFPYLVIFAVVTILLVQNGWSPARTHRLSYHYVKSTYNWANHPWKQPIPAAEMTRLPAGNPLQLPQIQHDFNGGSEAILKRGVAFQKPRQRAVKGAFERAWRAYTKSAWGWDELRPIAMSGKNTFNGWAATLVDSLDTLWLMGFQSEFYQAVEYVATIDWNNVTDPRCNLFETNIRYLGGLLSAYDLSEEAVLLDKAIELGDMLYSTFDTPNHFPPHTFGFDEAKARTLEAEAYQSAAGIGTLSLEFTRLAQLTGDFKYYDAIDRIKKAFHRVQDTTLLPGMWPNFIDVRDNFETPNNNFRLGGDGDSLYEYLPKMHILLGGLDPVYEMMYRPAVDTVKARLLYRPMLPDQDDILFLGTAIVSPNDRVELIPELEHLTCFAGGMFAMAGKTFGIDKDVQIGEKLARGCAWAYQQFSAGIMPEKAQLLKCETLDGCEWDEERWRRQSGGGPWPKGYRFVEDKRYLLRPEAIESLFILYRVTGKQDLQDLAWAMFEAIDRNTRTEHAYGALMDVTASEPSQEDSMESFFLAETLKYFYLIFSDPGYISLDEWVFNTEAHPFKRPLPS